ncbi:hypothetical protein AGMMS49982_08210 [Bacteroidia bacterium]|nr:hypothetical protein AGMMS49982_08210 [Bacteroidia bacterium]
MKKIKNVFLLAAMAVSAGFVGCNNEDDGESAGGGSKADGSFEIKATVSTEGVTTADSVTLEIERGEVLAKGTYVNGVLTITLPATLDSKYLSPIGNLGEGVTVSDPQTKWYEDDDDAIIYAWKNGTKVGDFEYGYEAGTAGPFYVDKDVTITGTSTNTSGDWTLITNYSVSLKKGWNIVVFPDWSENATAKTNTRTKTTTIPQGLKWSFDPD